jgi:protoporphyrinogen oxidase/SAM-dependent methyltransferase
MINVAIVGGGPGGLMTAWHLDQKLEHECKVTIFEASGLLGGKILSRKFDKIDALYEAGVAEIYGYWMLGPDPLREMIDGFGLETVPMDSETVQMDGRLARGLDGVRATFGARTANAIKAFRKKCTRQLSPAQYYEGVGKDDNTHAWMSRTGQEVLEEEVDDELARKFFKITSRSDVASEPHLTSGLNALKNFLMDVDGYIELYSIKGGNEKLIEKLAAACTDTIQLHSRVLKVSRNEDETYRLAIQRNGRIEEQDFDIVIMTLPHNWLATVEFEGELLAPAMVKHLAHFDRPAHYLRVTLLFKEKVWEPHVTDAWWMSDTFGGCCVYVENARHDYPQGGALGWLIAGCDALAYCNLSDEELIAAALDSLPPVMAAQAREAFLEGRVHRWLSSVNAIPGGLPVRSARANHLPEPTQHPGLFVVGDYLYDSTLNGLLDSADIASDLVVSRFTQIRYDQQLETLAQQGSKRSTRNIIDKDYFDNYRNAGPYAECWQKFFDPAMVDDLIRSVWKVKRGYRLLITGSASGQVVEAMRKRGVDAWGVENNLYIHDKTLPSVKEYNVLGTITDLPFEDGEFDVVYDTALCYVPDSRVDWAVEEIHRVSRRGLYFAAMNSDLTSDIIDRHDLMRGVRRLGTYWEWSDMFFENDFDMAIQDDALLEKLWARITQAGHGPGVWYDDAEAVRYSFYSRLEGEDDDE